MIVPQVMELLLGQFCKNTVVQTLNSCCPRAIIYQADLAEVVARLDLALLIVFSHVVTHGDLALATGNEAEELVVRVVLLAEDVFGELEARSNLVYQKLHDFSLVLKQRVLADGCFENVLSDLASETRRYDH